MGTCLTFFFFTFAVLWTGVSPYAYQTIGMSGNANRTLVLRDAGYISWTGFSDRYDDNQDLQVHFEVPGGKRILLVFQDINIENSQTCEYDRLEVCDGEVYSCAYPRRIVCGTSEADYISTSNVIAIRFKSDASVKGSFRLMYTVFSDPTYGSTCSVGECMCSNGRCISARLQTDGVNNCGSGQVSDDNICYDAGYIYTPQTPVHPMFPTDYADFYMSEHCGNPVSLGYSGYIQWDRNDYYWEDQRCLVHFFPPQGMQVLLQFEEVDMEGNSPSCSFDKLLVFSRPTIDDNASPDRTICDDDDDVSPYIGTSVGLMLQTDSTINGDYKILYTVFSAGSSCSTDEFRCAGRDQMCMSGSVRCDGHHNCEDKSDEYQCPTTEPSVPVAGSSSVDSTEIVIAAVVGSLMVVLLIVTLVVACIWNCNRRQARNPARSPDPTGTPLYPTGQQAPYPTCTTAPPYSTLYPTGTPSYPTPPPGHNYTYPPTIINRGTQNPAGGVTNLGYEPPPAYNYPPAGRAAPDVDPPPPYSYHPSGLASPPDSTTGTG